MQALQQQQRNVHTGSAESCYFTFSIRTLCVGLWDVKVVLFSKFWENPTQLPAWMINVQYILSLEKKKELLIQVSGG